MKLFSLIAIALGLAITFYLGQRSLYFLNLHQGGYFNGIYKKAFWCFLLVGSFSFFIARIAHPISDYYAPLIGNLLFSLIICFLYSAIIVDLLRLIAWLFAHKTINQTYLQISYIAIGLLLLIIGLYMASVPKTVNYHVNINKPSATKNLKMVQLSDIHISETTPHSLVEKLVERVNRLNPDYIFVTGDTLDMYLKPFVTKRFNKVFAKLKSTYGTYVIFGNHEHYGIAYGQDNSHQNIVDAFKSANMTVLQDDVFYDKRTDVYIIGREDHVVETFGGTRKSLADLTAKLDKTKPIILLDHQPRKLDEANAIGIDLMFSGHTHAGQVFPINLIVKMMYQNPWGIYQSQNKDFTSIVSSGYGLWGPPVRLMTRSELVVTDVTFK